MTTNQRFENHERFMPHQEENKLKKQVIEARKDRDKDKQIELENALVHLYIYYGEYFKMSAQPDPIQAKMYLEKALRLKKYHPVANYRLAHLLYREDQYVEAVNHFQRALIGTATEGLNDTQIYLTNMMMVNCGILIAKEALVEVESLEGIPYDQTLIDQYRAMTFVTSEEVFNRMHFRKITSTEVSIISEKVYWDTYANVPDHVVLLAISEQGYEVGFLGEKFPLETPYFYLLYTILRSKAAITNGEIKAKIFNGPLEKEISDDSIRQNFRRLKLRLPFLERVLEERPIGNKTGRKLGDSYEYIVLCRGSDVLPDGI